MLSLLRGSAAVAPASHAHENRHTVHGASNFAQHQPPPNDEVPADDSGVVDASLAKKSSKLLWPLNISSSPAARRRRTPSQAAAAKSVHGGSVFAPSHASIWPSSIFAQASPAPRRRNDANSRSSSVHGTRLWPHREASGADDPPVPAIAAHATFLIHPRTLAIETFEPSDDTERLQQMGRLLHEICLRNMDALHGPPRPTGSRPFDAPGKLPEMSVPDYLLRIRRYCKFSFVCFGVALTYMGRLMGRAACGGDEGGGDEGGGDEDDVRCLTFANVHRLLLASISLACKASDDVIHLNSFLALCGGVSTAELSALECALCDALHWRLMPNVEALEALRQALLDDPIALGSAWSHWIHQRPLSAAYAA